MPASFFLCHVAHEDLSTLPLHRDYAPSCNAQEHSTCHNHKQESKATNAANFFFSCYLTQVPRKRRKIRSRL
jgi:hypothetical protein